MYLCDDYIEALCRYLEDEERRLQQYLTAVEEKEENMRYGYEKAN